MTREAMPATFRQELGELVPRDVRFAVDLCLPGQGAAEAARKWNPALRVQAIDLSRPSPEITARLAEHAGRVECAVVSQPLKLSAELSEFFSQLRKVVVPGGVILAVVKDRPGRIGGQLPPVLAAANLTFDVGFTLDRGEDSYCLVRAVVGPVDPFLLQAVMLKPMAACNDKRVLEPLSFMYSQPGIHTHVRVEEARIQRFAGHKLIISQRRIFSQKNMPLVRRALETGYVVVTEFDDDPDFFPNIREGEYLTFRAVHGVQTSTPALRDKFLAHNPEVGMFPNQMACLPAERVLDPAAAPRLFFGAINRKDEWGALIPILNRVLAEQGHRMTVEVIHDREFYNALETGNKRFTPLCDYRAYLEILGNCDIALLPLRDTPFNRCKSDVKFIECAAHQVAVLASPTVYADTVEDGRTGLIYRNEAEFEAKLRFLVSRPEERIAMVGRARDYVARHRLMHRHFRAWLEWYKSLAARREELTEALYQRVPEMRPNRKDSHG